MDRGQRIQHALPISYHAREGRMQDWHWPKTDDRSEAKAISAIERAAIQFCIARALAMQK
ncbi:hypothetical protein C7C56_017595 [Massilia glaciei]|uniref:Uncharacterized protein n=1 Tax=Massilia glaciei TaxID=1524097 RepID=A0A2U2HHN9_9BURK|nr:hypothetical protein C7C56_017595 [Massilia glaciei]